MFSKLSQLTTEWISAYQTFLRALQRNYKNKEI